ncbi:MAG: cytidylate kinase-like family protein [Eubacterium sp.]
MRNLIIAIGREFGSGGKEIGTKLAEKLNIKCYDSELLSVAAKESGFCEEILQKNDEKPTNSFLYSLVMDTYSMSGYTAAPFVDMPLNHKVFLAQFEAIKKLASEESCVIVGRCADYALADNPDCFSVFIHADMDFRLARIKEDMEKQEKTFKDDNKLIDFISKTDKKRANYYNYYSSKKWGDSRSYDLTLNSSVLGIDKTVDMILNYIKIRYPDYHF